MPKGHPGPNAPTRQNINLHTLSNMRKAGGDPYQLITLARKHTHHALVKLIQLMNGNAGRMKVLVHGELKEVDIEVPAAVQAKCAEIIIERGYGKSPQAILLKDESSHTALVHALPIAERIAAIAAAREQQGSVTDLEASQQDNPVIELEAQSPLSESAQYAGI